jgi:hypothetical protein
MSVAVCVPIKYPAGEWLHLFLKEAEHFKDISRFIFSYGYPDKNVEGEDPTLIKLKEWIKTTKHRVEVYQEPKLEIISGTVQLAAIYHDFQKLVDPEKETHVLLADSDLIKMPHDLIQLLKKQNKDVIAPYPWVKNHIPPMFYDTMIFRVAGKRFHPLRPPMPKESFKVDSVGTCFLVRTKIFKEIPYRNPYTAMPFCNDARAKGYEVWADPRIKVWHLDIMRLGIFHMPLFSDETPFVTESGAEFTPSEVSHHVGQAYIEGRVPREVH